MVGTRRESNPPRTAERQKGKFLSVRCKFNSGGGANPATAAELPNNTQTSEAGRAPAGERTGKKHERKKLCRRKRKASQVRRPSKATSALHTKRRTRRITSS